MGLFDELQKQVGTALAGGSSPLVAELGKLLSDSQSGGLAGLVERFRDQGLGEVVDSWVSTGANRSISAEQVTRALGSEQVQRLAAATGIDVAALAPKLAEILPQLVNRVTPGGKLPAGGLLQQALALLQGLQQPKS